MSERDDLMEQTYQTPEQAPVPPRQSSTHTCSTTCSPGSYHTQTSGKNKMNIVFAEVELNRMAQRFYEATHLQINMTDKPVIVEGLRVALQLAVASTEPASDPKLIELGGQHFSQDQWDVVQTYAKGHALSAVQEATRTPETPAEIAQEMVSAGEQGLDYMLSLQRDVESVWGRMVDHEDPEAVSKYIREVILCAEDELHEVLGEVHWKPWKDSRGIKDMAKYREEMADVLHFILDLYLAAGLTGRDIIVDYMAKNYENLGRNKSAEYRAS